MTKVSTSRWLISLDATLDLMTVTAETKAKNVIERLAIGQTDLRLVFSMKLVQEMAGGHQITSLAIPEFCLLVLLKILVYHFLCVACFTQYAGIYC